MDRLISQLSDALASAVGDLVEVRADLVTADGKATSLFDECQRLKKLGAELDEVVHLVGALRSAKNFKPVTAEGEADKARDLEAAVTNLAKWLTDKEDREIPF